MNGDAIFNVTKALREHLFQALPSGSTLDDVYVGPLDDPQAQAALLTLCLYRIVPNAALRNRDHVIASSTPPPAAVTFRDSLPLDLYYLVTVGRRSGITDEQPLLRALGLALQACQVDPNLVGTPVAHETVHLSLEPLSTEEIARIWALFPTANYRTSIVYLASPVWIDPPLPPAGGPRVLEDSLLVGQHA